MSDTPPEQDPDVQALLDHLHGLHCMTAAEGVALWLDDPGCSLPAMLHVQRELEASLARWVDKLEPKFTVSQIAEYIHGWCGASDPQAQAHLHNALSQLNCDQDGIEATTRRNASRTGKQAVTASSVPAWMRAHSARYILEDADPQKLAECVGLPLGVVVAALRNILHED